ncbi:MAG: beta-galactosidase [Planctomycetota bacterium]|nr:beta-galactosidase [Planctomycetota bacterium]
MLDRFRYGVCYYPEHWPAKRHESDFRRIKASGFDFVRMGEGAWGYWEPREGEFQFDLFDRAIDLCGKYKIKVVLGTPTYCAPAWVSRKYPQVLRWDFNRQPMAHGSRRNFNYTSETYLRLSDRICAALGEHYRNEKQVIAWQLDNEFNCHMDVSYAPSDTVAFRKWLKQKYKSLDQLNKAWGTAFWSQQYSDWDEIDLPHPTPTFQNPTMLMDETRFISDCVVQFARRQAKILRAFNARWSITHNGMFPNINGPHLAQELDFFSHDQYPLFSNDWPQVAEPLAQARSLSFPFGVMEQQSGPGGQMAYFQRTPRPGELRLWAFQSVAHGAKFVSYFRWRTCPYGSEQHWHGLLDYDSKNTRRLAEAKELGRELRKIPSDFFDAAPIKAAAVLRDFDNEANERRINTYIKEGAGEHARWMCELSRRHIPADYVWPDSSLRGYRLLIAPHLKIVTPQLVDKLTRFVRAGGTLVLGAQSGTKDANCHMVELTPPGPLAELVGVEVEDWTTLPADETQKARLMDGGEVALSSFVERLRLQGAQPFAHWIGDDSLLAESPAITRHNFGKGGVIYIGGYSPAAVIASILIPICEMLNLHPLVEASDRVEAVLRVGATRQYLALLNHSGSEQYVSGLGTGRNLLTGEKFGGEIMLQPLGIVLLSRQRK